MLFKYVGSWSESLSRICARCSWNPSLKYFHVVPTPSPHRLWQLRQKQTVPSPWDLRTMDLQNKVSGFHGRSITVSHAPMVLPTSLGVWKPSLGWESYLTAFRVLDPCHFFLQKWLPRLVYLRAFSFAAYYNSPWEAVSDYPSFHPSLWPVLLLKWNVILSSSRWIE